jgi:hypothetical protein
MKIWQRWEGVRRCDEVENFEPLHCDRSALYLEQALPSNKQATIPQVRIAYVPPGISLQYTKHRTAWLEVWHFRSTLGTKVFGMMAVKIHNFRVFPSRSEGLWLQHPKVGHDIPLPCIYNSPLMIICTLYNQCGCETYLNKPRINQQTKHPLCKILLFPENPFAVNWIIVFCSTVPWRSYISTVREAGPLPLISTKCLFTYDS